MMYPYNSIILLKYMSNISVEKSTSPRRERFKRLAEYRTNEVLRRIKVLGNCANRSAYDYTEEEVTKIFSVIEKELKEVKGKFSFPKHTKFKL